jgi:hypothetical protein
MLKIAVGHSNDPDSIEAVDEAIQQCLDSLEGKIPQAGILFAAIDFEHELILNQINATFPDLELIGGTTDGEVSSVLGFQQDSLTLMLFCADDIEIRAAVGRNVSQNPTAIAQQTVETLKDTLKTDLRLCITTPESLTTSASSILEGLRLGLGTVPVLGGTTGDQTKIERTYQFFKTEVLSDSVPILLWGGNLLFSHGVASGWRPIGKQSIVTKVHKNIIYEIDDKPALEFYRYYFDDFAPDVAYPLAIFPPGEETFFLRGALSYDSEMGSLTVAADVPKQSVIQITDATQESIQAASKTAFDYAWETYPGTEPAAALFFSCAWRRFVLGTQTNQEYAAIANTLQHPIPSCGFYTYGEISPLREKGPTFFHNTTFVTLLLGNK